MEKPGGFSLAATEPESRVADKERNTGLTELNASAAEVIFTGRRPMRGKLVLAFACVFAFTPARAGDVAGRASVIDGDTLEIQRIRLMGDRRA